MRGKFPRFQVKRTIGERQQITGRLAHWFGNNFNASTALLITRLLKVALCSEYRHHFATQFHCADRTPYPAAPDVNDFTFPDARKRYQSGSPAAVRAHCLPSAKVAPFALPEAQSPDHQKDSGAHGPDIRASFPPPDRVFLQVKILHPE